MPANNVPFTVRHLIYLMKTGKFRTIYNYLWLYSFYWSDIGRFLSNKVFLLLRTEICAAMEVDSLLRFFVRRHSILLIVCFLIIFNASIFHRLIPDSVMAILAFYVIPFSSPLLWARLCGQRVLKYKYKRGVGC